MVRQTSSRVAFGKCKQCGEKMSVNARTCAYCGYHKKRRVNLFLFLILAQVGLLYLYFRQHDTGPMYVTGGSSQSLAAAKPLDPKSWLYFETRDDLVGDVTRHARVISHGNTGGKDVALNGASGMLELRKSSKYGKSLMMVVNDSGWEGNPLKSEITIKFDDAEVLKFAATQMPGADTDMILVDDYDSFVERVRLSHRLVVEADLPKHGERQLRFTTTGLVW